MHRIRAELDFLILILFFCVCREGDGINFLFYFYFTGFPIWIVHQMSGEEIQILVKGFKKIKCEL